ncbi:MAG: TRAP transporter substrate-binding protein DctP [Reyranella sp.]|nr:TRAP transporter substrate-binding protein DctP [Reyranella sp.]
MSGIDRLRLGAAAAIASLLMAAAQPASAEDTFNWRFGIYFPSIGSLEGQHAQEFVKAVAERSDNRLQIEIFPGGMLGFSSFTHHRVVGDGLLEMGTTMSAAMIDAPEWETLSHALLFKNRDEANAAWEIARPELEAAAERDFHSKVLGVTMAEFDHMLSRSPLPTVESWKGHKFRAWQKQLACWFEQMSATPMVIPYHEAYTALATGVVEGNSGGLQAALDTKLYEATDYVSTGWTPNIPIYVTLVNQAAWDSLPEDLQKILAEESDRYFTATSDAYWQLWPQNLELLAEKGMEKVAVSDEELAKGRELARVCWDKWRQGTTPEAVALMDKILAGIGD